MYLLLIVIGVLLVDQGSKFLVRSTMSLGESIPVAANIFHITYIENPGAAFGLFARKTWLFIIITLVVVAVLLYLYRRQANKKSLLALSMALVIGGAVGNLLDRLAKGTVTDMFDFRIWPVFNVADAALVVGLCFIAYRLIFHGEEF